ncbi:hypothetical protein QWZ16_16705 [Vibrio ostreicida]|uniref:Uncharacterized protein n=1 Tax=Vibrio ostreicida TaxID=526588 RepID=A0ABT8BWR4_9VIBR|nr:hypothetical protein [Vibrio ostreicida]MDN3611247.1 hypothetical protein [Vibrio ostreicida]
MDEYVVRSLIDKHWSCRSFQKGALRGTALYKGIVYRGDPGWANNGMQFFSKMALLSRMNKMLTGKSFRVDLLVVIQEKWVFLRRLITITRRIGHPLTSMSLT